jgi:excisionase family DNA binding protein
MGELGYHITNLNKIDQIEISRLVYSRVRHSPLYRPFAEIAVPMIKEMLTTDDLAEYLQIHKNQIYRLIREGRLPATRITGKWLFPKQLIDQWVTESARESTRAGQKKESTGKRIVIAGSNDLALEALTKDVQIRQPDLTVSLSNLGSLLRSRLVPEPMQFFGNR